MDPQAQVLLHLSADDEATLLLSGIPDFPFGFHAQQAIEKLMKALMAQKGIVIRRTHGLNELAAELAASGEAFPSTPLALSEFQPFAVMFRYESPHPGLFLDRAAAIEPFD